MTLLRYAVKNIKKESVVRILAVLQLAVIIVISVVMSSSVLLRYRYYAPFGDILQSNGILCDFMPHANYDEERKQNPLKYIADDELKNFIPDIVNVVSCNSSLCFFVDNDKNTLDAGVLPLFYDDEIIGRYKPELSEGRWLNKSNDADCIEGVISENTLGIKVGDKVKMGFMSLNEEDQFKDVLIVGKISTNSKIVSYGMGGEIEGETNMTNLYETVNPVIKEETTILLSSDYLSEHTSIIQGIFGPALVTFPENYPQEKIEQAREQISEYNCRRSMMLSEVNEKSIDYILEHIKNLLPIIIVLGIMTVISAVSNSALSTRRDIKDFAIFYINGLRWKHCALISLIQALIMAACSVILAGFGILALTFFNPGIKLIFRWETIMCAAAIVLFFMLVSLIMPLIMLSRTTPKQILTR